MFADVRDRVFMSYCVRCHVQYADYTFAKKDIKQILLSVENNRMPKNAAPLSQELKDLLKAWDQNGSPDQAAQNTQTPPPATSDELAPTWDSLYANIFVPKCVVCHSPNGVAKWIDVSSRAGMAKTLIKHINFAKPEDSYLVSRLKDKEEPMPPLPPDSSIPQLTEKEVGVVIEWIKAGLP